MRHSAHVAALPKKGGGLSSSFCEVRFPREFLIEVNTESAKRWSLARKIGGGDGVDC